MRRLIPACAVAVAVIITAESPCPPSAQRPWTVVGQKSADRVGAEVVIVINEYDAIMPRTRCGAGKVETAEPPDVARAVVNGHWDRR
jgi:hypothetical protein